MGADYARRRARRFRKGWDAGALSLAEATLFTRDAGNVAPAAITVLRPGVVMSVGDRFVVRLTECGLEVFDGTQVIAECVRASAEVRERAQIGGMAEGRVLCVNHVGGYAELVLC